MQFRGQSHAVRYTVGAAAVALAVLFFLLIQQSGFPMLLAAVAFVAWFGGLRPGLLATGCALFIIISSFLISQNGQLPKPLEVQRWVLFTLLAFLSGSLSAALQAAKRQAEEMTRDFKTSEERYRRIVETANEGICTIDAAGRISYANPRTAELLGYHVDEMVGRPILDFVDPAHWQQPAEGAATAAQSDGKAQFDAQFLRKDGSRLEAIVSMSPARDDDGEYLGSLAMLTDVTARKRAEEVIHRRNRELIAINSVAGAINSSLRLPEVLETLKGLLEEIVGMSTGGIFLYDESDRRLKLHTGWGLPEAHLAQIEQVLNDSRHEGQPLWKQRTISMPEIEFPSVTGQSNGGGKTGLVGQNSLCVPFSAKGEAQGVLLLFYRVPAEFGADQVDFYTVFGHQVGVAVQNARLFEQVRASRRRLKALTRRLVEVQEAERRAIARELHDEIGQILTGLKLSLEMAGRLPSEKRSAALDEPQTLVNRLLAQVRALSLDLRPTMLDDLGLLPALLWHFEHYTAQTGIHVVFEHSGLDRRFPPEIETAAYRIVQEALTNVARHAKVTEVTARFWANQDSLGLQVEDRGVGFAVGEATAARTSTGLSSMNERAFLLRGRLTVESSPGAGTSLMAELPLNGVAYRTGKGRRT